MLWLVLGIGVGLLLLALAGGLWGLVVLDAIWCPNREDGE